MKNLGKIITGGLFALELIIAGVGASKDNYYMLGGSTFAVFATALAGEDIEKRYSDYSLDRKH